MKKNIESTEPRNNPQKDQSQQTSTKRSDRENPQQGDQWNNYRSREMGPEDKGRENRTDNRKVKE